MEELDAVTLSTRGYLGISRGIMFISRGIKEILVFLHKKTGISTC